MGQIRLANLLCGAVIVVTAAACGSGRDPVNQGPVAHLDADPVSGEAPLQVAFNASGSSDDDGTVVSYRWVFGDGEIGSGASATHTYSAPGSYTATLTVTDDDGATDSVSLEVDVTAPANVAPSADFSTTPPTGAAPLVVNFDASGSSDDDGRIVSYQWAFGDGEGGSGATTAHTYSAPGNYLVTLTVTDDDGAMDSVSQTIEVTASGNVVPTASFTAAPSSGVAPLEVEFDASGSADGDGTIVSYLWSFGDGESAMGVSTTHTYSSPGSYTATLTVTDDGGATASVSQSVNVLSTYTLSGSVNSAVGSAVDSDVNDPNAPYAPNDDFDSAQALQTPLFLGGFASADGTGASGDRFGLSGDKYDVYALYLVADQSVTLSIADHDSAAPADNDLDLYLYSASDTVSPLASSAGIAASESVVVPATGAYYVEIEAYNGISNYVLTVGQTAAALNGDSLRLEHEFVPGEVIVRFAEGAAKSAKATSLEQVAASLGLSVARSAPGRAGLLRAGESASLRRAANALHGRRARSFAPGNLPLPPGLATKHDTLRLVKALRARGDVEYAEPNYIVRQTAVPNDQYYPLQWHYPLINLPQAWEITTGTPDSGEVIVAILDTGIVSSHPELTNQITGSGYDFVSSLSRSNDGDGIDADPEDPGDSATLGQSSFHGTHVAGTVAAQSDNNQGVAGVSWGARIMPIRVLGVGGGTDYELAQGIRYAAGLDNDSGTYPARRADIINLSLGSPAYSTTVANAVLAARAEGVIIIAAAGNEDSNLPFYPASYNGVVSVSAVEMRKERAPYSNFGAYVDVAAPGGDMRYDRNGDGYLDGVLSTRATDISGTPEPIFSFRQGTSMAAPHVAGVAALMRATYPQLTPDDFDSLLASGLVTEDLGDPGRDDVFGYGLIDALAAVEQARALGSAGELPPLLTVSPTALDFGGDRSSIDFVVANAGAGTLTVTGIDETAPWLSVQATDVDDNDLGTYTATVDRTVLPDADAVYRATITVTGNNNSSVGISVVMYVGSDASTGDVGHLYVLLLDPATGDIVDSVATSGTGGVYDYTFSGLLPGSYRVMAGSDSDNDFSICDPGEACGGYPTLGLLSDILVDSTSVSGIDFGVDFLSTLPAATALPDGRPSERRIPQQ